MENIIRPNPYKIGELLKKKVDLVTIAFGNNADEKLLSSLASTPDHFYSCQNGQQLRSFMARVGTTLQQTIASQKNATKELTRIQYVDQQQ